MMRGLLSSSLLLFLVLTANDNVAAVVKGGGGGRLGGRRGRAVMTAAPSSHAIIIQHYAATVGGVHRTNTAASTTRRRRMAAFVSSIEHRGSIDGFRKDATTTTKTMMQSSMTSEVPLTNRSNRGGRNVIFNGFNIIQQRRRRRRRSSSLRSNTARYSSSVFSSAISANDGGMMKTSTLTTTTTTVTTTTTTTTVFDEIRTLLRVLLPSIIAGLAATFSFTWLCQQITTLVVQTSSESSLLSSSTASSTFVNLIGLLYSILLGQLYSFLYTQQESLYYALYDEVTEAKSLLEQVGLLASGRVMYRTCLMSISRYVKEDLLGGTTTTTRSTPVTTTLTTTSRSAVATAPTTVSDSPSILLSARPTDDPLEAILYLTSVGIPSQLYDTVRSLRRARSRRLGAIQRKVPILHLVLLSLLGGIMLASFPISVGVERASSSVIATAGVAGGGGGGGGRGGNNVIVKSIINRGGVGVGVVTTMQSMLFGTVTFAVVMCKMVLIELWRMKSRGAYSVDKVLRVMVRGLQCELDERMVDATQPQTAQATMTIN